MMKSDMNECSKSRKRKIEPELWMWLALCVCAMAGMLVFAANKTIVIAEIPSDLTAESNFGTGERSPLILESNTDEGGSLCIPLPGWLKPENIAMDNRYLESELWLYIQSENTRFYEKNALTGDTGLVKKGSYEVFEDGILLRLEMQRLMEYRSTLEGDKLVVACYEPGELYERVVILDPTPCRDELSEDVTLSVARLVQENLSLEGVRVYLLRAGEKGLSEQERLSLIERMGADIYVGLGVVSEEDDPDDYGILSYYNETFFNPEFTNVELADLLTREVTTAVCNRAQGLKPIDQNSLLRRLEIPAAWVSLGYLSNSEERALLIQESYQVKLAEGISAALDKAYERLADVGKADSHEQ